MKKRNNKKKTKQSNFAKLSIFQNQKYKFKKMPLSGKGAPIIDYKNIKLLKKFVSENGKFPIKNYISKSKETRELSLSVKRARKLSTNIK